MKKSQRSERPHQTDPKPKRTGSYVFFSVLLVCLLAVGGVAVSTFSENLKNTVIVEEATPSSSAVTVTTTAAPVVVVTAATTAPTTTEADTTETTAPPPLYVCPLNGDILTAFSEVPTYNDTMDDHRTHRAIDFSGTVGDSIAAFSSGEIIDIGHDLLIGDYVTVDHGSGIVSTYGGVKACVDFGDHVETGDAIGTLSEVPFEAHLTPHLHFEVTRDGQPIDPTLLLE